MNEEKNLIMERFMQLIRTGQLAAPCTEPFKHVKKNNDYSEKLRKDGNNLYLQKGHDSMKHQEIMSLYNQSIAYAPKNSENLATAYANKSALLRHVCKYTECISEVDKALKITKSNFLKVKLFCRKAECLSILNSSDDIKNLEKAKFVLSKLEGAKEIENALKELIMKTESMIIQKDHERPKRNKIDEEITRSIEDAEEIVPLNSVEVRYSEKFGPHLVAARDFKPGEIIIVEKPYCAVTNVTFFHTYAHCQNCPQFLWNCIPCDHCTWCLFCSEQCRDQAWKEHHDIECSVVTKMLAQGPFYPSLPPQLTLRTLLKAIRQAGGIMELWEDVKALDPRKDYKSVSDEEFADYKRFYSLRGGAFPDEVEKYSRVFALMLLLLAEHSSILGRRYTIQQLKELMKNKKAITLGGLLMKTWKIVLTQLHGVYGKTYSCEIKNSEERCKSECCGQRACTVLTRSLIPLSCCPNVSRFIFNNPYGITFTLAPIKKGEQLFSSVYSVYEFAPKPARQKPYRKRYGCDCDCDACKNDWTEEYLASEESETNCNGADKVSTKTFLARAALISRKKKT